MEKTPLSPTTAKERHVVLDALRGLALLGIALANFPEFALWTFLSADEQSAMPTAGVDRIVRFRFGPLEWIWRMLTYGNYFKMLHYS